ncbi:MAG TPA: long-chain fatty acid--CoA ligase [Nitrososphaerales archaeon]|nr:long-chain fatty acid--CoA ligase [Nitrososphaerales archaeon]
MQLERTWYKSWPAYLAKEVTVPPQPLHRILSNSAKRLGSKPCLHYQGRTMTYSEVDELSSKFASGLLGLGLKKGDRVGIFSPNTPQFVISYFGILKAGGIVVPCSPLYKERELEAQLRDSGATMVVAANDVVRGNDLFASLEGCRDRLGLAKIITASVTDYLPGIKRSLAGLAKVKNLKRKNTVAFVDVISKSHPIEAPANANPIEDVAVLQYTGGTTGVSKGAILTHYNLLSAAAIAATTLPMTQTDVCLAVLPLFHIFGMTGVMNAPLWAGGEIVLLPRFEIKEVMAAIQKEKVTVFCGVPTMYVAINHHPDVAKFDLKTVRLAFSGGAPLPIAVRRKFNELTGGNLVEGYGLTESSAVGTTNPFRDGSPREGSIGFPFPSTDAKIVSLDDPSSELAVGEIGEFALKGPQIMTGYWNNESETGLVMKDGWLLTGDIARMDDDGFFYIVDRKKDMVSVGGLKVYPREVEEVLFEHPAVKEAAVIGIPDQYMGEIVKAFIVLKDPSSKDRAEGEILEFCKGKLAKYKVPRNFEFVPDLPKTLVGKVLRRKLKETAATAQ